MKTTERFNNPSLVPFKLKYDIQECVVRISPHCLGRTLSIHAQQGACLRCAEWAEKHKIKITKAKKLTPQRKWLAL